MDHESVDRWRSIKQPRGRDLSLYIKLLDTTSLKVQSQGGLESFGSYIYIQCFTLFIHCFSIIEKYIVYIYMNKLAVVFASIVDPYTSFQYTASICWSVEQRVTRFYF